MSNLQLLLWLYFSKEESFGQWFLGMEFSSREQQTCLGSVCCFTAHALFLEDPVGADIETTMSSH